MPPDFRTAKRRRASAGQILLAVMLLLTLLSSVAPFNSLASHRCQMACCIGKPPHAEGSCSVAFMNEEEEAATDNQGEDHSAHHQAQHSSEHQASSNKARQKTASIAAHVVQTPCSPECAAVASASARSQRPRQTAAMSMAMRPRPPSAALLRKDYSKILLPSSERRRQIHPRAPPASFVNLSA